MSPSMQCPSCGCRIDPLLRYAHMVVCDQCRSAVVLDEQALRLSGTMAVLAQTPGPLYVGGSGRLEGQHGFSVLGRIRYGYRDGYWDEWYVVFEGGHNAWIGEDENNFSLEVMVSRTEQSRFDYQKIDLGHRIKIDKKTYHVDEKGEAVCEGGEGQLPFSVVGGERIPFIDLSCGKRFATIEFEPEGATRLFVGTRVNVADIQMDQSAQGAGVTGGLAVERPQQDGRRARVVVQGDRTKALSCFACAAPLDLDNPRDGQVQCAYCGAVNDPGGRHITCSACGVSVPLAGGGAVKSVSCPGCRQRMDVSRERPSSMGGAVDKSEPLGICFKLGQRARLRGEEFVVAGVIRLEGHEDDEIFWSTEYLLYSKRVGYRWLNEEMGHFSLATEIDERPEFFPTAWKQRFSFAGRSWRTFGSGETKIQWVDGQLPWVAKVGDTSRYLDAVAPPYLLSRTTTESEQEYFQEAYLSPAEVAEGFGMPPSELPTPVGVGANQPYAVGPVRRQARPVVAVFAMLSLLMLGYAWFGSGTPIGSMRFSPQDYAHEYLSPSFAVTSENTVCRAGFSSAVDNGWVYLDAALIDANDQAVLEFSAEMSYYHGYEGGESWSEGSGKDSVAFRVQPGEYRLLVKGQSNQHRSVAVDIMQGVMLKRYWAVVAAVLTLYLIGDWLLAANFEKQRWGESWLSEDD